MIVFMHIILSLQARVGFQFLFLHKSYGNISIFWYKCIIKMISVVILRLLGENVLSRRQLEKYCFTYLSHMKKTRLFKYIENVTTKKLKIFR